MKIGPVACKPVLETEADLDAEEHSAFTGMGSRYCCRETTLGEASSSASTEIALCW